MKTYTKGITLPIMRPVPMPIPEPVPWWNLWGKTKIIFFRARPRTWEIMEDYLFYIPWLDITICIPKGFIFDGASIPRPLWPFMAPTGMMFIAGLFHDCGYRYNSWMDKDYNPIFKDAGKKFFDEQFKRMGKYINDAFATSNIAWAALYAFGFLGWKAGRKENRQISVDYPPKYHYEKVNVDDMHIGNEELEKS